MKPRLSASLILCRESLNNSFEVLMLRRKRNLHFSNALVFPGGSMDPPDLSPFWLTLTSSSKETIPKTLYSEEVDLSALRITAIRETWEETGVLLSSKKIPQNSDFLQSCKDFSSIPKIEKLHYFCRIIAPKVEPKRFDTSFFICIEDSEHIQVDNIEADHYVWSTPVRFLEEYFQGQVVMWPPQLYILKKLSLMRNLTDVFWSISGVKKVPLLFQIEKWGDRDVEVVLPGDFRHDETHDEIKRKKAEHYIRVCNGGVEIVVSQLADEFLSRLVN